MTLQIISLEERIVLDGAGAGAIVESLDFSDQHPDAFESAETESDKSQTESKDVTYGITNFDNDNLSDTIPETENKTSIFQQQVAVDMGGGQCFNVSHADMEFSSSQDFITETIPNTKIVDVTLIDITLTDYQDLVDAVYEKSHIIFYDGDHESAENVLALVVDYSIEKNTTIESLSIMSHGSSGEFKLGNEWIGSSNLSDHIEAWYNLDTVMNDGGNLYIYLDAISLLIPMLAKQL